MIVVFDSCIWKQDLYLRSSAAAAVRFYLGVKEAKVGLPEVVRLEVERHLRADIMKHCDSLRASYKMLLGLVGRLHEIVLPTDDEIDKLVASIFSQSGFNLLEIPFSEQSARLSFLRTIDGSPPSHKKQQFKDGVIWEDCKRLAELEPVVFVTNDNAFYGEGDNFKRPNDKLAKEIEVCAHSLLLLRGLPDFLKEIEQRVVIPAPAINAAVSSFLQSGLDELFARMGFVTRGDWSFDNKFYATEEPDWLYVDFAASIDCDDIENTGRHNATLRATATGRYDVASETFTTLQPSYFDLTFQTSDGAEEKGGTNFGRVEASAGHRVLPYQVRTHLKLVE